MVQRFGREVLSIGARENIRLAGEGGRQLQQAGERFQNVFERIEESQTADYISTIGSQLTLEDNQTFLDMQQQRAGNPEMASDDYLVGLDERYDEAIDNAPNKAAKEFLMKKKDDARTRYGVRSQTWEHNQGIQNQITRLNDSTNSLINASLSAKSEQELLPIIEQFNSNMALQTSHMNSEQIKQAQQQGTAAIYNSYLNGQIENNYNQVEQELNSGKYDEILDPNQKSRLLTLADNRRIELYKQQLKLFNDDPAAWAMTMQGARTPEEIVLAQETGMQVENPYTGQMSMQVVPPDKVSVIPKQQAQQFVNALNNADNSAQFTDALQRVNDVYGNVSDIAMRDLSKAGLSDGAKFVLSMNPESDAEQMDAFFKLQKEGPKAIKENADFRLAQLGETRSDLKTAINGSMGNMGSTGLGGFLGIGNKGDNFVDILTREGATIDSINSLRNNAENLANYYLTQGDDVETAVEKASDWMNRDYILNVVNGTMFRVPQKYGDNGDFEDELNMELRNIKEKDIKQPTAVMLPKNEYVRNTKERGYFALNPTQDGVILYDEYGSPIFKDDNTIFELKFEALETKQRLKAIEPKLIEQELTAKRRKETTKETLQRLEKSEYLFGRAQ